MKSSSFVSQHIDLSGASEEASKSLKDLDRLDDGERLSCLERIHRRREICDISAPQVKFIASFLCLIDCIYRKIKCHSLNV